MLHKERRFYEFGPFRIDPARRLLLHENQPVALPPKAFDILLVLVENAEQVVLKDEILRAVWPDTFVEESNLAQHIFVLRKTLGDAREARRYIITVPGRGYCFTEKVRVFDDEKKEEERLVVETHSRSQVIVEEVTVPALIMAPASVPTPKGQRVRNFVILAMLASLLVAWIGWSRAGKSPHLVGRQLTANPPEDWVLGAAISPDGKHVAYHDQTGLYVRSIDSGETRAVALTAELRNRIVGLRWFPDGGKLLAEVSNSDGRDLWVIAILGEGDPHLLYRHAWDPDISPDGQKIAFAEREVGGVRWEIWVGGINGEEPRKLVDGGELQAVAAPAWSPDGRWIAYARRWKTAQGWSAVIEVRPAGGGSAKTLVAESVLPKPNVISAVSLWFVESWSPDWRLVFSVAEKRDEVELQTKSSLWAVRVEPGTGEPGGKPVQLTPWSEAWPLNLAITPDGKRLSFVKGLIWTDVYLGELGPDGTSMKVPRRLTFDNRGSELEAWTHDGQAVLYVSARNGRREIFRQRLNDNVPEIVVTGRRDAYGVAMSPEGYWLLDMETEPTRAGGKASDSAWLMRRPVGNGLPELVLELPSAELDAVKCSSNPAASVPCVMGLREGKNLVFYSLDPVRGKGAALGKIEINHAGDLMGWDVSPDGSRVALVDREKYGGRIEILTLLDGTWHEVYLKTEEARLTSIAWAVDGKSFFVTGFLVAAGNPYGVLHIARDGRSLFSTGSLQWVTEPRPSPDGKYLAFTALTYDSNVWMIENF